MNKITALLLIVITALGLVLVTTMQSKASDKTFAGIVPFVTNNDRLGFFNQNSGQIYIYDNNLSQCLYSGQMQRLGQPIQEVKSGNLNASNPSTL